MPIDISFCDIDDIVEQVVDGLSLAYQDCFKVQSKGKCDGYWDENGIRRIVENSLTNAIKYKDNHSEVTISLLHNKSSIELSVHNFGQPIPPDDIPILFEQFRRLKSSKDNSGWRLGLTMVKGMVDAHNDSIIVESDRDDGTTFL